MITKKFLLQRLLQLFDRKTIDSYRVRVLHPLLALKEVLDVYTGFYNGSIKNFETVELCVKEAKHLLKRYPVLTYTTIDEKFFKEEVLNKIKKDVSADDFALIATSLNLLIEDNKNFGSTLLQSIKEKVETSLDPDPYPILKDIYDYTGIFATELIHRGYDKSYLYPYFRRMLDPRSTFDTAQIFHILSGFIQSKNQDYTVWFKIYTSGVDTANWARFPNWNIRSDEEGEPTNKVMRAFFSKRRHYLYTSIDIAAKDHYSALRLAKQGIAEVLDSVSISYVDKNIKLQPTALVFPKGEPEKLKKPIQTKFVPDGNFSSGDDVLHKIHTKLTKVLENEEVNPTTKEKIKSALRYLRYGHESFELEHQLINYWIGLEYLFSNDRDSTFTRIKEIFPNLQAIVYIKRNFQEFHNAICQCEWEGYDKFSPNQLNCILDMECLKEIRDGVYEDNPLLSFRAWKILNQHIRKKETKSYVDQHTEHLKWHLSRIYRVRNEIVHEAKYSFDNQTLSSNLRYYLAFSISIILDYFSADAPLAKNMEAFFAIQKIQYGSMQSQGFPLDKLLSLSNEFDLMA